VSLFEIDKRLAWLFLLSKNKTKFQEVFLSIPSQYSFSSQDSLLYSLNDLDFVYPFLNGLSNENLQNFAENYERKLKGKITFSLNAIKEIDKSNNFKNKIFTWLGKMIYVIVVVFFTMLALYAITIFRFNKKLKKTNAELVDNNKRLKMRNDEVQKLSRELSHRLKNDLLIVESILKRQMRIISFQGNQNEYLPFLEAISSIETLRLAHQHLVTADTLGKVDTFSYFKSIVQYFEIISKGFEKPVIFNTNLSNTSYQKGGDDNELLLPIALAIRLGRILNELLTNALKYAGKSVDIQVFIHFDNTHLLIIVSDNGIGMPKTLTENFGLTMIRAEIRRLQGALEITENHPGTKIKIVIQKSIVLNYLDDHEST
jgi:two-component sensor histidine kinase